MEISNYKSLDVMLNNYIIDDTRFMLTSMLNWFVKTQTESVLELIKYDIPSKYDLKIINAIHNIMPNFKRTKNHIDTYNNMVSILEIYHNRKV